VISSEVYKINKCNGKPFIIRILHLMFDVLTYDIASRWPKTEASCSYKINL